MRRKWVTLVWLLVMVISLAACAPAAAPTPTPTKAPATTTGAATTTAPTKAAEPTKPAAANSPTAAAATPIPKPVTLKFGTIQSISDVGVYVAIDKGYYKEQGITIELTNFRNASEAIPPLGAGQVDFISTPLSAALLAAADRGIDLRIVADKGQSLPKWEFAWIVLRKDLADSGQVKTPADLKGMKIAIPSIGSLGDQTVQLLIEQAGLKASDVEVPTVSQSDQAAAFGNKAIGAGYAVEPYVSTAVQKGFTVKWLPQSQFTGGKTQVANIVFGAAIIKDPDVARRFMVAYLKGVRDYLKAFGTNQGRDEIVKILTKYTTVTDPTMYDVMEMPYVDPNGMPDKKSTDLEYQFFVSKGVYTGKKTFDDITDLSFVQAAAQQLGKQ